MTPATRHPSPAGIHRVTTRLLRPGTWAWRGHRLGPLADGLVCGLAVPAGRPRHRAGTEVAVTEYSVPNRGLPLSSTLFTWLDPTGQATSQVARENLAKNAFTTNTTDEVSYDFVSCAIWARVELPPVDSNCYTLLVLEQPRLLRIDVFDPTTNGPRSVLAMGAALPFHERALPYRFPSARRFARPASRCPGCCA